jgi:FkbM family methyltransferase
VLSFRLTTDPWFLCHYRYRPDEQYFEDFLALPPAAVFVDAGAFQGETSLEFARRYPDHGAIYAFEPSDTNADVLEKQTLELQGLQLHRVGLSDEAGVLRFASELGSASRAIEEGNIEISVIRLDDLELKRADLIKMDLEGGENRALQGGVETIRRCRSRLAIGAYHDPNDFAILHRTAKDIHPESRFYLRHYTSGWAETDLFCVPL